MTYNKALKVKIGDILHAKDGYTFTVDKIIEETNVANTEKFLKFFGKSTRGIDVFYTHKNIR
jgi:hypothetical protein